MSQFKDMDLMMDPGGEIGNTPPWLLDKSIDTRVFCEEFLEENPMLCINNQFFSVDGLIADENSIKKKIYEKFKPWFAAGLPNKTTSLLDCLRIECYSPPLPVQPDRIHVGNGTYFLNSEFVPDKEFCLNRLSVRYNPDAPAPEKWLEFLNGLLVPEDILTLQEFIGYCLIPTTKAQKMLFLIGKSGEGKSRIGVVLRSIFGDNMNTGSLFKVEENRFARADLEYSLLMVDDPFIADKMAAEAEGIFLWALEGLNRLRANDFRFTMSERSRENMTESVKDANNIIDFLSSEGYIRFKADYEASTKELYDVYKLWCDDNAYNPLSSRSFAGYLAQHADDYNLETTNNIRIGGGKRCRGYLGIEILNRPYVG